MMSLVKLMPKQLNLLSKCAVYASARSYYPPAAFGIDAFKNFASRMERENQKNYNSLKQTIQESLGKPDTKIFTEDLKAFLYLTKTDNDLDLLIAAIKKYNAQDSMAIFNFNFETPLMRLLYTLNKTDRALDLFMKDEIKFPDKSYKSSNILLNKLLEESKYDEAIKVYDKSLAKIKNAQKSDDKIVPSLTMTDLVTEALLEKGDVDALKKAKAILKDINENKFPIRNRAIMKIFLIALQNNEPDFAYETVAMMKETSQFVANNLKILSLLQLNRKDEALKLAVETEKFTMGDRKLGKFFKTTLDKLLDAFKEDKDNKKQVDDLLDSAKRNNYIMTQDLKEYAKKVNMKAVRPPNQQQPRLGGTSGGVNRPNYRNENLDNRKPQQAKSGNVRNFTSNNQNRDQNKRNENKAAQQQQ